MFNRCLLLLFALLAILSVFVGAQDDRLPALPPFVLPTVGGGTISDLDLSGDAVLMFTVPGCGGCSEAIHRFQAEAQARPEISFFLAVPEDNAGARTMIEDYGITWPVIVDNSFLLASIYTVRTVPHILFLRNGQAVHALTPEFTAADLDSAFVNLTIAIEEETAEDPFAPLVSFYKAEEPLLLFFAGAECPYCHMMLPEVFEIARWFHVTVVITEELDDPEPFETSAPHVSMVLDPTWRLADLFGVGTVPCASFIARDGSIIWEHEGLVQSLSLVAQQILERSQPD